jgi:hypothetical protein
MVPVHAVGITNVLLMCCKCVANVLRWCLCMQLALLEDI